MPLGLHHPLQDLVPNSAFLALGGLFLMSEVVTIAIGMLATSTPKHKGMWKWVPTLHFYYPLGTLAAIKGLWEVVTRPYYWDKTTHGLHDQSADHIASEAAEALEAKPFLPSRGGGDLCEVTADSQNRPKLSTAYPKPAPLILGPSARIVAEQFSVGFKAPAAQPKGVNVPRSNHAVGFSEAPTEFQHAPHSSEKPIHWQTRKLTFGLNFPDHTLRPIQNTSDMAHKASENAHTVWMQTSDQANPDALKAVLACLAKP